MYVAQITVNPQRTEYRTVHTAADLTPMMEAGAAKIELLAVDLENDHDLAAAMFKNMDRRGQLPGMEDADA